MANIGTNAEISKIRLSEQGSDPTTPASGYWLVYAKADGLYLKDDAGNVTGPFVPHAAVTVSDTTTVDLTLSGQQISAAVLPGGIDAADLASGAATDGYVLTADGAGGAAWEAATGGSGHDPVTVTDSSTIDFTLTGQDITASVLPGGIKLDDFATPDDNTDLDATTGHHGLLPKLGGGTTNYLRADGTWAAPAGGSGMTNPMTTEGDLIVGGASGTPGRLAIGANTYVLTSNGTTAAWAAPAVSGSTDILMAQVFS